MKRTKNISVAVLICSSFIIFSSCSALSKSQNLATELPAGTNAETSETVKCKENDFDCFSQAAGKCRKAEFVFTDSGDLGDFTITKSDYFEIKGGSLTECRLYLKNLRWDSEPEKYTDERMKNTVGKDGICKFPSEKLVALLERWKKGSFSTEDYKGFGCKGTYFSPENGFPEGF